MNNAIPSKQPSSSIPSGKVNHFPPESGHFPPGGSARPAPQHLQAAVPRYSLRESEPLPRGIRALPPLACQPDRPHSISRRLSPGIPSGKVNRFHGESGHFPPWRVRATGPRVLQASVLWHSHRESEPLSPGIRALSPLAGQPDRPHSISRRLSPSIPSGKVNHFPPESGHFPYRCIHFILILEYAGNGIVVWSISGIGIPAKAACGSNPLLWRSTEHNLISPAGGYRSCQ